MKSYEDLLTKAVEELPEQVKGGERFTVDKIKGHIEGNKTVLVNLKKIAKDLERDETHLLKYLLRELATPGKIIRGRVILGTKVSAGMINKKIKKYVSEFVFCAECSKPDTSLTEEKGITYLKCQACGAKKPVKNI
ncbi:translation initiation factor IF-2 subunit beta [Candidatus Woesearchaeota archaeon]|jgi:translation initiation factor 2 subunit 2|nr:translation initiation factor IF-2 subunit beta [Candidatus Woesearchaeota archaeon]MBT5396856.1 translation initiation factor IF-2 subunit beta [Candidatus Woesearchaeota archaeon]MBT6367744.1 translation initiation factor IF-2 subunit beta [Candidatus Woesearchaeota archaeon]MBT7762855.1 translation initiation factor IF-2 subunit beta [Candidatus Woesearchaeota archaeon]